jgi:ubiquinone/menaquinone biosynthesis C-methylase UbiE
MDSHESKDRALFDGICAHYRRKDEIASTRIAREGMVQRLMAPVIAAHGGLGTVVEIGCGVGATARYLQGQYERYIGIDYSEAMIDAARAFNAGLPNVSFIAANVKQMPLETASADTMLMIGALHHMTELDEVIAELGRVAKPGATFVTLEPQRGNPLIQALRWLRAKLDPHFSEDQHYFTRAEIRSLLEDNGLERVDVRYFSLLAQPLAQVVLNPQALTVPLSRLSLTLDPILERLLPGEFGRLAWLVASYANFPGSRA